MSGKAEVLVAGGGIAGLTLALTLHQIGVPARVFEAAERMKPMGVGINIQPNAVRELFDLGIRSDLLDRVGLPAREWALVGLNGNDIYAEPRGLAAGYGWPQYAVHRGAFHMMLYREAERRLGADRIVLGTKVTGYAQDGSGVIARLSHAEGTTSEARGALLIGADGIRSAIREQMHPDEGHIHWGGALMWRGTVRAKPIRTGSSFVGLGTGRQRMVIYPISHPGDDGRAVVNWIAEVTVDAREGWTGDRWFAPAETHDFVDHFEGWRYPWLDVPEMLAASDVAYVNPMIDRDIVPTWVDGRVGLMGDAAHAMLPFLAQGGAMALEDAAVLRRAVLEHGIGAQALAAYDGARRPRTMRVAAQADSQGGIYHMGLPFSLARDTVMRRLGAGAVRRRVAWIYEWSPQPADRGSGSGARA